MGGKRWDTSSLIKDLESKSMQPVHEDFTEIKKKSGQLNNAVTNRSSQFRIPTFICGHNNDKRIVLRKSDQQNNLVQFK